jgi:hypothetical protein
MTSRVRIVAIVAIVGLFALVGSAVISASRRTASGDLDPAFDTSPFSNNVRTVGMLIARNPLASHLGVGVMELGPTDAQCLGLSWPARGVIVDCVISGCFGAQSGLKLDDVIVGVNAQPVFNRVQFWSLFGNQPGTTATLDILRGGQQGRITVGAGADPGAIALAGAVTQNPCAACPL